MNSLQINNIFLLGIVCSFFLYKLLKKIIRLCLNFKIKNIFLHNNKYPSNLIIDFNINTKNEKYKKYENNYYSNLKEINDKIHKKVL
jgi:hypothetical protein